MELSRTTPLPVRVSIGVATRSAAMMEAEDLYSAADGALYEAKQSGRDRVVVAPGNDPRPAVDREAPA